MSSANRQFLFLFNPDAFYLFFCYFISLARTSHPMWHRSNKSGHPWFDPSLKVKAFYLSSLNDVSSSAFLKTLLNSLKKISSMPSFLGFNQKWITDFCQMFFCNNASSFMVQEELAILSLYFHITKYIPFVYLLYYSIICVVHACSEGQQWGLLPLWIQRIWSMPGI